MLYDELQLGSLTEIQGRVTVSAVAGQVLAKKDGNRIALNFAATFNDLQADPPTCMPVGYIQDTVFIALAVLSVGNPNAYFSLASHGQVTQYEIVTGGVQGAGTLVALFTTEVRLTTKVVK